MGHKFEDIQGAALVLAISAFVSQLLALTRDRIFAHQFGTGEVLDIYFAAFRVPDFIFTTIASLVSMTILIPFFTRYLANGEEVKAKQLLNSALNLFLYVIVIVCGLAFIFMDRLVGIVVPGFIDEVMVANFVLLSRIILLQPILLGISNLLATVVHSLRRFFIYALTPLLYNLGIIIGATLLYPRMGISGLAWGVVLGALLHLLVQLPTVIRSGYAPRPSLRVNSTILKEVLLTTVPRTFTLGVHQLVLLVLMSMASILTTGSISVFSFSFALQSVPLAIIGMSFSVAAFPTLSALYAKGDKIKFLQSVTTATRHIIFWSLPIMSLFIVLRAQIVRTILGTGEFDWTSTRLVAASLALFSISVVAQSLVLLFVRAYYAIGNTRKPLVINSSSSAVIIALSFVLVPLFAKSDMFRYFFEHLFRVNDLVGTSVLMLPLAYTIGMIVNLGLYWVVFNRDFYGFHKTLRHTIRHSFYAAVIMGFVSYLALGLFDNLFDLETLMGVFLQGFLAGLLGIVACVVILKLIGNKEINDIGRSLRSRFWKSRPIGPALENQSEL